MKFVSVAEMVAIEKESNAKGHSYSKMMENAGRGLAEAVHAAYDHLEDLRVLGLVGSGNNGGDTLVACAYLQEWGWRTTSYIVKPRPKDDPLVARVLRSGGTVIQLEGDPEFQILDASLETHPVWMDGVLGTGIRLPLRGVIGEVLDLARLKAAHSDPAPHIVAVDCPSGVDCDTGEAAEACIPAEITVTMAAVKQGILKFPAYKFVGDLQTVGIGLPDGLTAYHAVKREVITRDWVRERLPTRPLDSHKSTFGVVMVLGGSLHYSGAVLLAGKAAFRSGAGWVTLAVPEPLHPALAGSFIEATWVPLPHRDGWIGAEAADYLLDKVENADNVVNVSRVSALLVGPGMGIAATTADFLRSLLSEDSPKRLPAMVVDADGLKLLAEIRGWPKALPGLAVLTPHPGEMAGLTGLAVSEIQSDRVETAENYAREWDHVVVLKGAFTIVASPQGDTAIIPVATPALARAGTGDVLAGLITGLRAQGMPAYEAAAAGAWIHAQAGLWAADDLGTSAAVLAGDVLDAVVEVLAWI